MPKSGFTLIELIVVMAVIALMAAYTLSNYKSFGEDQNLKNAVLDIQSLLRTAQTNATANVGCSGPTMEFGAKWRVRFFDERTIYIRCKSLTNDTAGKVLYFYENNVEIVSVSGTPSTSCPSAVPFNISFAPLSGKMEFEDSAYTIMPNCTSLVVTLKNTKTKNTQALSIDKGGNVYAQ